MSAPLRASVHSTISCAISEGTPTCSTPPREPKPAPERAPPPCRPAKPSSSAYSSSAAAAAIAAARSSAARSSSRLAWQEASPILPGLDEKTKARSRSVRAEIVAEATTSCTRGCAASARRSTRARRARATGSAASARLRRARLYM